MKKIISAVLAGAVMLGLSACAGGTGPVGTENVTEEVQSESEVAEEETATTNDEVVVAESETETPSDDVVVAESFTTPVEDVVVAESESNGNVVIKQSENVSADVSTDTAARNIMVDFTGKSAKDIAENIMSASKIQSGETIESYLSRFSITPNTSCDGNLWTLTWPEDKLTLFSVRQIQIKTTGDNNTIDEDCDVVTVVWIDDEDLCTEVSDYIREHDNLEPVKRPASYNYFEVDGLYQYTLQTPVKIG